jgi:hypothetical protein
MASLITYYGSGFLKKEPRGARVYTVCNFSEICEKIIPFFQKHKIRGVKSEDFADWCKIAELIKVKDHLTFSGLDQIRKIKSGMNKPSNAVGGLGGKI